MCKVKQPKAPPAPTPAPVKTSADIQKEAEKERLAYGYGGPGAIASTVLTSPLGIPDDEDEEGIVL